MSHCQYLTALIDRLREQQVKFCRLEFCDIFGVAKSIAIPLDRLSEAFAQGIAFDGSSIEGFVRVEESDMLLVPDADTCVVLPWGNSEGRTAKFICQVVYPDGSPFEGCPRTRLIKALQMGAQEGYRMRVGLEVEFYLLKEADGRYLQADRGHYFDLLPHDAAWLVRRQIVSTLQEIGIEVLGSYHESAPGQQEIMLSAVDALRAADNFLTLKSIVKWIAREHGFVASFMPKPFTEYNGSGLHLHLQLLDNADRDTLFSASDEYHLSSTARKFIAGLLVHAQEYSLIVGPTVNSYKRLVRGCEAPRHACWALRNRSPLVRIPAIARPMRLELRNPDPTCNIYLALTAIYHSGLAGIKNGNKLPPPLTKNAHMLDGMTMERLGIDPLPHTLGEALQKFKGSALMRTALGQHIFSHYVKAKQLEWEVFRTHVHQWELEQYLEKY